MKPRSHQPGSLQGLYAITDSGLLPRRDFVAGVEQALQGGARIIQYRDKTRAQEQRLLQAQALRELCSQHQAILIINDDIALAKQVQADGVHLGLNDRSISQARTVLGSDAIIGVSCYNRIDLAQTAAAEGADYLAFGAFFASPTKPRAAKAELALLQRAQTLNLPICAIGGITTDNAASLITAGADMLAVISAVFGSEDIRSAAQSFSQLWPAKPEIAEPVR